MTSPLKLNTPFRNLINFLTRRSGELLASQLSKMQTCQPSRFPRDHPAFSCLIPPDSVIPFFYRYPAFHPHFDPESAGFNYLVSHLSAVAVSALAVQVNKLLACCFNLVLCLPYPYAHQRSTQQLVGGGRGSHCRLRDSTAHAIVVGVSGGEGWLVGWVYLFMTGATNLARSC